MKVPRGLLNQTADIKIFEGATGLGPKYGPLQTVRCRIENRRTMVRDADGNEVLSETRLFFYPESPATEMTPESVVIVDGYQRTIISVDKQFGLSELGYVEVMLK